MAGCPADQTLVHFVEGRLSMEDADRLRAHIDGCATCLRLLVELGRSAEVPSSGSARPGAGDLSPPLFIEEYRLLRPLGQGAMGQVHVAHDTRLDRQVAIKLIAAPEPDEAARDRFFVEARAIARLA